MEALFGTLAQFTHWGLTIYEWIIIIAILLSWVNPDPSNPIVQFLNGMTRPFWAWIAKRAPAALLNSPAKQRKTGTKWSALTRCGGFARLPPHSLPR